MGAANQMIGVWLASLLLSGAATAAAPARVAIDVLEPADKPRAVKDFPVTVGLVFPAGELAAPGAGRLVDDRGQSIPFESQPTGWWDPEKTKVKWLLLRFHADTARRYFFEPGGQPAVPQGKPLAVEQGGDIVVDTGPLQVRLSGSRPVLFQEARLHGQSMLDQRQPQFVLVTDTGKTSPRNVPHEWKLTLEESTPLYAAARAELFFHDHGGGTYHGQSTSKLTVRYEFHKDQSFVRVYHSFTWMVLNPGKKIRELTLGFQPSVGAQGTVRLGVEDEEAWQAPWTPATQLVAQQDSAEQFTLSVDNKQVQEGRRLGGWLDLTGLDGRGVSVSLRHAWQMYPKAFEIDKGQVQIQLWPRRGPRMSFHARAIMGDEFFYHPIWKIRRWTEEEGHYQHEREGMQDFLYTAQGAARTHEMTFHFHDQATSHTPELMNSLTQHPVVLRQDPALAMRVPFMGVQIMPVNPAYPEIERAVETLGRMSIGRWPAMHEFGFWRFGMVRWGFPANSDEGRNLYRWHDGGQYDQQLIPWLLFLRGGDRRWFEEAQITSRYLMDVGVNHYNSRGYPTGYLAMASGTPWAYFQHHNGKSAKVHFLTYYHHLTGSPRAREVMETIIAGNLATAAKGPGEIDDYYVNRPGGRETYNMNVLWATAWEQTFDPRVKAFAKEWKGLAINREYNPDINEFRPPRNYLYNGLLLQYRLWPDPHMREVMLKYLEGSVLTDPRSGENQHVENVIGTGWAYEETGDRRYAEVAWDVARSLADMVPDMDFTRPKPAPYFVPSNAIKREFLDPILVGASLAARARLEPDAPLVRQHTFFSLQAGADRKGPARGAVLVRPRRDGPLELFVRLSPARNQVTPVALTVTDARGRQVLQQELVGKKSELAQRPGPGYNMVVDQPPMASIVLPEARQSETYRLSFEGGSWTTCALVLADAQIVHHVPAGQPVLAHDLANGARFYTRTVEDVITIVTKHPRVSTYVIRDATTGELLFRSTAGDADQQQHALGKGRLIEIRSAVTSAPTWSERTFAGVEPWFAVSVDGWFAPEIAATAP